MGKSEWNVRARTGWNGVVIRMSVVGSSLSTSAQCVHKRYLHCCMAV